MIKEITVKDFNKFAKIEQAAYAGVMNGTQEEADILSDVYRKFGQADHIRAYGYYDEDLIGCLLYYECKQNFHGEIIETAGIGSLAVDLLHKKKHVAQKLIKYCIDLARNRDVELFHLYPFKTGFYRNFGFGYSPPMATYHIKPDHLANRGSLSHLRRIDKSEYETIHSYHDHIAHDVHGMTLKTFGDKYRLERMKSARVIVHEKESINGYMIYSQESLKTKDDMAQKLIVHEALYTKEALLDFMSFLHVQKDQIDYIEWATHDQNLHYLFEEISFASDPKTLDILSLKSSENALGIMPMALHPDRLLKRIAHRTQKNVRFKIHFPQTAVQTYNIHFSTQGIEIELSINDFSSWVTGAISLQALYDRGLITCNQGDKLGHLDRDLMLKSPINLTRF